MTNKSYHHLPKVYCIQHSSFIIRYSLLFLSSKEAAACLLACITIVALGAEIVSPLAKAAMPLEAFPTITAVAEFAVTMASLTIPFGELVEAMVIAAFATVRAFIAVLVIETALEVIAVLFEAALLCHLLTLRIGLHCATCRAVFVQASIKKHVFTQFTFEGTII